MLATYAVQSAPHLNGIDASDELLQHSRDILDIQALVEPFGDVSILSEGEAVDRIVASIEHIQLEGGLQKPSLEKGPAHRGSGTIEKGWIAEVSAWSKR